MAYCLVSVVCQPSCAAAQDFRRNWLVNYKLLSESVTVSLHESKPVCMHSIPP